METQNPCARRREGVRSGTLRQDRSQLETESGPGEERGIARRTGDAFAGALHEHRLKPKATAADAEEILAKIAARSMKPLHISGIERVVIGALGDERALRDAPFESHPAEESVKDILLLQIGARNMQSFALLKGVGQTKRPEVLKRGHSATIEELLLAAEYVLASGNEQLILSERGIRTFENATHDTLDLNAVSFIKQRSHLPLLVDPSHGTGVRELVIPMAHAAAAIGAD